MRTKQITLTGVTADDNGIVASVTPAAGGEQAFTLLATSFDPPRRIEITPAADETSRTFTITGVDRYGLARTETLAGTNATAFYSNYEYSSISEITVDDDTAGAIIIGWSAALFTQWIPLNRLASDFKVAFAVQLIDAGMSATYTVQHTLQQHLLRDGPKGHNDLDNMVFNHPDVAAETGNDDGNYAYPVEAIRVSATALSSGDRLMFTVIENG